MQTDLAVIGAGPGGYAAAFRAADAGRTVVLIEKEPRLGGVCLNHGCIPSKALLHATHAIPAARDSARRGITFAGPAIDLARLREWKEGVLNKLGNGISVLANKRGVTVLRGLARFTGSTSLEITGDSGVRRVDFANAIIATGSRPALPKLFDLDSPLVMTSTEALRLEAIPGSLLVIGGGYIGMELGTVYAALGTRVTVVEALDGILAGADPDLSRPVMLWAKRHFKEVRLKARVAQLRAGEGGITATIEHNGATLEETFDRVLVSVGRGPNHHELGLEHTGVRTDERGFIVINADCRTDDPAIFAIGDAAGGVMLAHKAAWEAGVAVNALLGRTPPATKPFIPAVVFTDPEVAWVGLTETEAKVRGVAHEISKFMWGANGRALTLDRVDGATKLILEPGTGKLLGVGLVGPGAGELIAEATLALETGAGAADLARTIHPHPTLSETLHEAAEIFFGHSTHTLPKAKQVAGSIGIMDRER